MEKVSGTQWCPKAFATFWAGNSMPALDRACVSSFLSLGGSVSVYSFDKVLNLPDGVVLKEAGSIVHAEDVNAFLYGGAPNLSHFSDYFRYRLFQKSDETWIDTDLLQLRTMPSFPNETLFAKETKSSVCGAIMRIPSDDPRLEILVERAESLMDVDLVWGATGPRLLNKVLGKDAVLKKSHSQRLFFPIHYDDFWKPFLPAFRNECEKSCSSAVTLHLWNNILVKAGIWKEFAPPEGSYLHSVLVERKLLHLFQGVYPVTVMENMITNWLLRKSGGDIGVVKVAKQAIPSFLRTTGPRVRALLQSSGRASQIRRQVQAHAPRGRLA